MAPIDHVDDFLAHVCLADHPDDTGFRIESMSAGQYARLVVLAESYFVAGYEWFPPAALRQRCLASRLGPPVRGEPPNNRLQRTVRCAARR